MRDVELYRHLLGLEEPWTVWSVELNVQEQRVDVWAGHAEGSAGRVPSVASSWGCTTMPRNASGAISTVASS